MPYELLRRGEQILDRTETEAAVSDYLRNGGVNLDPATKAWCASFVNATLAQEGFPIAKENALSFKNYGDPVLTPQPGDIGVFSRDPVHDPDAPKWQGHAGIYAGSDDDPMGGPTLLSGNVDDSVGYHLMDPDRLIGWRRPPGVKEDPRYQTQLSPEEQARVVDLAKGLSQVDQRMRPGEFRGSPGEEWMNRYRNRETAYKLQQLEAFPTRRPVGQVILSGIQDY